MKIKKINIVCHSHYNLNDNDHQSVVSALNKQIIDRALELVEKFKQNSQGERFCWTAETSVPILEWWAEASPNRRRQLIDAVENGYFEVCAFPYNISASISESEVNKVANWIPTDIFNALNIRTVIQSGIDGVSAAAVNKLKAKGIRYVWVMPSHKGTILRKYPFAFNWKITASGRVLAFQGGCLGNFTEIAEGRAVVERPIKTADTSYSFRKNGDMMPHFSDDEDGAKKFVAEAYVKISNYIADIEKNGGYPFTILPVSYIPDLRGGNEPPCEDIVEFVKLWNAMGFKPKLAISTAGEAFAEMEVEADAMQIPTFSGQWPDTFSKDLMSSPKEVALNRETLRLYKHIQNLSDIPVSGDNRTCELIMRDVCSLYEHNISTYDHYEPIDDITIKSSEITKFAPIYRAFSRAEYLLSEKLRRKMEYDKDGIYVYNPLNTDYSGEIHVPADRFNGEYISVMERDTMTVRSLSFSPSNRKPEGIATFWADIPAASDNFYTLMALATPESASMEAPVIETDSNGWPLKIKYADGKTISTFAMGDIEAVIPKGGRNTYSMIKAARPEDKDTILSNTVDIEEPSYSLTLTTEKDNRITVTQEFMCSAGNGKRVMTIYKGEPRVNVTISLERLPGLKPAAIYAKFSLDTGNSFPVTSCGGLVFDPTRSILHGCDNDYIAIDNWISYPYAKTVLFTKDTPFVSFGGNNYLMGTKMFSENKGTVCPILFDNTSDSNVVADSYGTFKFSFDIIADDNADDFNRLNLLAEKCFASVMPIVHIH